jgi:hypothetical protein
MRKVLLPLFAILITAFVGNAQNTVYRSCATEEMWKEAIKADPDAALRRAGIPLSGSRKLPGTKVVSPTGVVTYKIPVVFHVMHTYGPENISKAQIQDAVNSLNLSFQKLNPDTGDVIPLFQSIFANCEIGFELANIDPDGNCTDGITRTYTEFTNAANDNVKSLVDWPCDKYLNIWVVKNIASGAAGYAGNGGLGGYTFGQPGNAGAGGGGGGGASGPTSGPPAANKIAGSGGGVGLLGQGPSGAAGTAGPVRGGGGGGSGGAAGSSSSFVPRQGGLYGGGGGGGGVGAGGGVRIIYDGTGKSYPSNAT